MPITVTNVNIIGQQIFEEDTGGAVAGLPAVSGAQLTNITAAQVGALAATAAAGGDLTGNFPNPTVSKVAGITPGSASGVATLNASTQVVQRLSYEGAASGVATLDGSSKLVQDLADEGAANGVATLNGSTLVVQNPANATATPTANKIPIADGSGKLDGWVSNGQKQNQTTVDPTKTDDSASGYAIGSIWFNTTGKTAFVALSVSVGAAVWVQITDDPQAVTSGKTTTGKHFFGNLFAYPNAGKVVAAEIQLIRTWLVAGTVLTKMEAFINNGATGNINLGIYDQATLSSISGTPHTLLASTGTTALAGGDNGTFKQISLSSPLTISQSGYYWLAVIGSSNLVRYAATDQYLAGFMPVKFVTGAGTTLTTPDPTLQADAATSMLYVAAVE